MIAKAPSLNVVQFNGYNGCIYCYMRGIHENHRHLYPCTEPFVCRSPSDFRANAISAEYEKKIVNGIKGRCFLDEIIQIPFDVPIDAMHQVFLGCAKSIIVALVGSLSKHNSVIAEDRLRNCRSPRYLNVKAKPLSELLFWKARDFKCFLFHYGSFCLEGLIQYEFHLSFNQLSYVIRLLSMRKCVESHLAEATKLTCDFLANFVELYGRDSQSFNFHTLRHLTDQG